MPGQATLGSLVRAFIFSKACKLIFLVQHKATMSFSDSGSVTTIVDSYYAPPFMRLPTEVREMVYRHLLIVKYTMREHNMNSKEVGLRLL